MFAKAMTDLQSQYTNYKTTLQSLAQKVGEIEQEIEEHKYDGEGLAARGAWMLMLILAQACYRNTATTSRRPQVLSSHQWGAG